MYTYSYIYILFFLNNLSEEWVVSFCIKSKRLLEKGAPKKGYFSSLFFTNFRSRFAFVGFLGIRGEVRVPKTLDVTCFFLCNIDKQFLSFFFCGGAEEVWVFRCFFFLEDEWHRKNEMQPLFSCRFFGQKLFVGGAFIF